MCLLPLSVVLAYFSTLEINTKELLEILELTPADQNIMLSGKHCIGKSEILSAYFSERGFKVVALFLGQMSDSGDLIGLPAKDDKTGRTVYSFRPTSEDWLVWAKSSGVDKRVVDFIEANPEWLDNAGGERAQVDSGLEKFPDRRAWKRVSDIVKGIADLRPSDVKILSCVVGFAAAKRFINGFSVGSEIMGKDVQLI